MVTGVCWYVDRNGIDNFNVKVIKRFCYITLHNNDAGLLLCINILSQSCMTLYSLANMLLPLVIFHILPLLFDLKHFKMKVIHIFFFQYRVIKKFLSTTGERPPQMAKCAESW